MSSYLNKKWDWDITTIKNNNPESGVNIIIWEADSTSNTTLSTDSNGKVATTLTEAIYKIDNVNTVTKTDKTPHRIAVAKYGLNYTELQVNFIAKRVDTFYLSTNPNITETNKSTVDAYTGISVDHTNKKVTISTSHMIQELYDYLQSEAINNPQKDYPIGFFTTNDGNNFYLYYDLTIDGCAFTGKGKTIDMSNNTFTLTNGATSNVKIKDINGVRAIFELINLKTNSEVRIYKRSNMNELAGIENTTTSTFTYNYTHTADIDVTVVVFNKDYKPIRLKVTLTQNDTVLPIQQEFDRNYNNP